MFTKRITLSIARRLRNYVAPSFFVYLFAAVVGIITSMLAYVLHLLLESNLYRAHTIYAWQDSLTWRFWVVFLLPFIGVSLSFLFQLLLCEKPFVKSLTPLIEKLERNKGVMRTQEIVTHLLSSSLAVGFGGSAGLEAPSVLTGAAVGSFVSRILCIQGISRTMLVSCGAAAAISAVFHSPIAAVLFVAEVLLPEFTLQAVLPPLIASASSFAFVKLFLRPMGPFFMNTIMPWNGYEMLALLLCGCFTACIGALLIKAATLVGALLNRLHGKFVRLILGGLALSCILIVFPMLRGQGYESIEQLLIGDDSVVTQASWILRRLPPAWLPCLILFAVFILKPIASALTIGIGDGGIFAPTIFIGAFAGYTFAKCVNMLGLGTLNTCNFAAFGICGVFATVMRSPLTAIFLVIETTGQLVLMAPLMVVSAVSVIIGHFMVPSSIYRGTKVGDKHGEQKA